MINDPQGTVLVLIAVFGRVGACFMFLPGFSSARIPMQLRLYLAVAVSMALLPILWDRLYAHVQDAPTQFVSMVFVETAIGAVIGLIARFFVLGLQFAGTVITMLSGFNAPPASDILESESSNQVTNLISFGALMVLFSLNFHHVIIAALADSYQTLPVGGAFDTRKALVTLTDTLSATFMVMLRLSSPFIAFGFLFNVAIGFINKLSPQIPIYFISAPFQILAGLVLMYFGMAAFLKLFADAFLPVFNGT
ncbi:flagellar biosynthetic protein FliR [Rhizobium sp. L1K21]|uniref:flagellar biosynthetic protein FliR n=1 Tax=Rhizobium sp. L1K21 TaxID=2954933 RepID=UPI0020932C72|nr:flagellar biosynthetic protein FliR [Rhizobium sp. L1K21]MCO6187101.1 flagellar type III secretion system protein FliR [Rhizobium sp. L1K21]